LQQASRIKEKQANGEENAVPSQRACKEFRLQTDEQSEAESLPAYAMRNKPALVRKSMQMEDTNCRLAAFTFLFRGAKASSRV
jgi:hypothetical protein